MRKANFPLLYFEPALSTGSALLLGKVRLQSLRVVGNWSSSLRDLRKLGL